MKKVEQTEQTVVNETSGFIIMHHLASFQDNDLESVVSDYTNESVLVTQDATYKGPGEIKGFFAAFMEHFPKQQTSFTLDKVIVNNELVYIVWHADTPTLEVSFGTDTFIVRHGKIYQQTFAGQMKFIN